MNESYKIHVRYIISILITIIVILLAVEWSKIPDLINYINFALTVSSLILATLAIVYSIVTNNSLGNTLHNLHISSDSLKNTSREIDESNKILLEEIKKIPAAIESIDENVTTTKTMIEDLSLKQSFFPDEDKRQLASTLTNEMIIQFLNNSSIRGLESLFCVVLSKRTKTAFKFEDICEEIKSFKGSADYLFAYLVAASSLGLLTYTFDGKDRCVVDEVHSVLLENIESVLSSKLEETAKEFSSQEAGNEEEEKERWFKSFKDLKGYFGESEV